MKDPRAVRRVSKCVSRAGARPVLALGGGIPASALNLWSAGSTASVEGQHIVSQDRLELLIGSSLGLF